MKNNFPVVPFSIYTIASFNRRYFSFRNNNWNLKIN